MPTVGGAGLLLPVDADDAGQVECPGEPSRTRMASRSSPDTSADGDDPAVAVTVLLPADASRQQHTQHTFPDPQHGGDTAVW
jgi:hypothetical protein